MYRPRGIQLKRERNDVYRNPEGISPKLALPAGRAMGPADLGSLMIIFSALVSKCQPYCPMKMLSVTVHHGDEALASDYKTIIGS
jgi:hypothetical protein